MSAPLAPVLEELESMVRAGQVKEARSKLLKLPLRKASDRERLALAKLARRAGAPELSIQLLHARVRSERKAASGTPEERAEYAAALRAIGAVTESLHLLSAIDGDRYPEALLFRTHGLIAQWDYGAAIPLLRRYLRFVDPASYEWLIGEVNLLSCLIAEGANSDASQLLPEVLKRARERKALRLLANCHELGAQLAIELRDFPAAEDHLDESRRLLEASGSMEALFIEKWRALLKLKRAKDPREATGELIRVREGATVAQHWETVRECDLRLALSRKDPELFARVHFGTPHRAYRARMVRLSGGELHAPETYTLRLPEGSSSSRTFDVTLGQDLRGGTTIPGGRLPHQLLQILASDFYRPFRPAELVSRLFVGEVYHPVHSIDRLHHILSRLRSWLSKQKLPLRIAQTRSRFSLQAQDAISLLIGSDEAPESALIVQLRRLDQLAGKGAFSAGEAGKHLKLSHRSASRLLAEAVEEKALIAEGKGPARRYRFVG